MSFSDVNHVTLIGRLTRDAETKFTASGTAVTKFSLAVNESQKKGETWTDYANFFDCILWGREKVGSLLTKGKKVLVTGALHQERWEKEGQKQSRVSIKVDRLEIFPAHEKAENHSAEPEAQGPGFQDDEIPF